MFMKLNDDFSEKIQYDFPDCPVFLHRGLLSRYPGRRAPNHWHNDVELIYVLSGRMKYNVNGQIFLLRPGEGIFVNSGQMHFGFSDGENDCRFICALMHPVLLCPAPAWEENYVLPLIENSCAACVHLKPNIPWQKEICQQICSLEQIWYKSSRTEENTDLAPLKALSVFSQIWYSLCKNVDEGKEIVNRQSFDLTITKNMVGFIQKNYTRKITLADIASSGAVGESKCCRLFSKFFSLTPNAYLNQYRLDKSIYLLENTDLAITEIALQTGFCSASYYAECFRKWFGQSPTKYRKSR